jgi:DNA-binding MarR family transcriptional regulator
MNLIEKRRTVSTEVTAFERDILTAYGMTFAQYETLTFLRKQNGPCTMGVIADIIGCTRGNMTGIMDRLERDGWITRDRSAEDRREVNVTLTAKACPALRDIESAYATAS